MDDALLVCYQAYTPRAYLHLLWRLLRTTNRTRRLSILNRLRDYQGLAGHPSLFPLHRQLNEIQARAAKKWSGYDYGEGYFYQSLIGAGVSGLRDTEARIQAMDLRRRVSGKRVLEVGCNSGFLSLSIANSAQTVTGFDINPYLIEMAIATAKFLAVGNVQFMTSSFEEFTTDEIYDVLLSFANHSTFDGNTRQTVTEHFDRCRSLLAPGGFLLFESHAPAYEGRGLADVIHIISERFSIREQVILRYGTFLDDRRTFLVAIKQ